MNFESPQEQNEQPPISLLEDFDACVDAVVRVEQGYTRNLIDEQGRSVMRRSMSSASEDLRSQLERCSVEERDRFVKRSVTGFQGLGGFNRYEVRGDGTMLLSRYHTVGACSAIAQEVGIGITEY